MKNKTKREVISRIMRSVSVERTSIEEILNGDVVAFWLDCYENVETGSIYLCIGDITGRWWMEDIAEDLDKIYYTSVDHPDRMMYSRSVKCHSYWDISKDIPQTLRRYFSDIGAEPEMDMWSLNDGFSTFIMEVDSSYRDASIELAKELIIEGSDEFEQIIQHCEILIM